jgi:biopolymer transport protein ExbD
MSHVGGSGDDRMADPNLTPLLDLVLQLLMFFIVCVNFATEQVSGDIKLPYSDSARPIDKDDLTALYINQKSLRSKEFLDRLRPDQIEKFRNQDSVVLIPGVEPKTMLEAKSWLKQRYEDLLKASPDGEVKTVIHFRPDADLEMSEFLQLMQHCKVAGFKKLKVRAIVRGGAR